MTELIEPYRVGVGVFSDEYSAATACTEVLETAQPDPQRAAFYTELFALYKQSQCGLAVVNHALSRLPVMPVTAAKGGL